jgi:hypothetical protein
MDKRKQGAIITALIVGAIAIGVFAATIAFYGH